MRGDVLSTSPRQTYMKNNFKQRLSLMRDVISTSDVDALLIFGNTDLYGDNAYFKWATGVDIEPWAYLFVTQDSYGLLVLDYLVKDYKERYPDINIVPLSDGQVNNSLKKFLQSFSRVGLVGPVPVEYVVGVLDNVKIISGKFDDLIAIKSEDEVRQIGIAAQILSRELEVISKDIKPGITARQIADLLKKRLFAAGCTLPFSPSVVTSSLIKTTTVATPRDAPIRTRDIVCIDAGISFNGFCADCTRMYFINSPGAEKNYKLLLLVNKKVIDRLNMGFPVGGVQKIYIEELEKAGMKNYRFEFSDLGHGIGFNIHENPLIGKPEYNSCKLLQNVTFTLEPELVFDTYRLRVEEMVTMGDVAAHILTI